jgi:hypothetical protein
MVKQVESGGGTYSRVPGLVQTAAEGVGVGTIAELDEVGDEGVDDGAKTELEALGCLRAVLTR